MKEVLICFESFWYFSLGVFFKIFLSLKEDLFFHLFKLKDYEIVFCVLEPCKPSFGKAFSLFTSIEQYQLTSLWPTTLFSSQQVQQRNAATMQSLSQLEFNWIARELGNPCTSINSFHYYEISALVTSRFFLLKKKRKKKKAAFTSSPSLISPTHRTSTFSLAQQGACWKVWTGDSVLSSFSVKIGLL